MAPNHRARSDREDSVVPTEVEEGERELALRCTLGWVVPGTLRVECSRDSIDIQAERPLYLEVERSPRAEQEIDVVHHTVQLKTSIDPRSARAVYQQGVLTIRLERAATAPLSADGAPRAAP